mmetsp:Transcript_24458/g.70483  ORF Transcript_24458/g.70483 Transcript_24458/m.70483 type:complete len:208 (-) Transcript_24458:248-871(-)
MPALGITIIAAILIWRSPPGAIRPALPARVGSCAAFRRVLRPQEARRRFRATYPAIHPRPSRATCPAKCPHLVRATCRLLFHLALPLARHRRSHRPIRPPLISRRHLTVPRMARARASPVAAARAADLQLPARARNRRREKARVARIAAQLARAPSHRRHTPAARERANPRFFIPPSLSAKAQPAMVEMVSSMLLCRLRSQPLSLCK